VLNKRRVLNASVRVIWPTRNRCRSESVHEWGKRSASARRPRWNTAPLLASSVNTAAGFRQTAGVVAQGFEPASL